MSRIYAHLNKHMRRVFQFFVQNVTLGYLWSVKLLRGVARAWTRFHRDVGAIQLSGIERGRGIAISVSFPENISQFMVSFLVLLLRMESGTKGT